MFQRHKLEKSEGKSYTDAGVRQTIAPFSPPLSRRISDFR